MLDPMKHYHIGPRHQRPHRPCAAAVTTSPGPSRPIQGCTELHLCNCLVSCSPTLTVWCLIYCGSTIWCQINTLCKKCVKGLFSSLSVIFIVKLLVTSTAEYWPKLPAVLFHHQYNWYLLCGSSLFIKIIDRFGFICTICTKYDQYDEYSDQHVGKY